jgi:hypothetical protein
VSYEVDLSGCSDAADAGSTPFHAGNGLTVGTPYLLCTATHLNAIGDPAIGDPASRLNKYYKLGRSINMNGVTPTQIGCEGTYFTGNFNGNSKTISNLTLTQASTDYTGLFCRIGTSGVVSNLTLSNVSISGQDYVGGLAGYAGTSSNISSINISGAVSGRNYTGGMVGYASSSTITQSTSSVSVTGSGNGVGGLGGVFDGGGYSNLGATGDVTVSGSVSNVGGLVGIGNSSLSNSYATGHVSAPPNSSNEVGGLAGYGNPTKCFATGNVTGGTAVGGLIGS